LVESKNASIIVTSPLAAGEYPAAPVPTSLSPLLRELHQHRCAADKWGAYPKAKITGQL